MKELRDAGIALRNYNIGNHKTTCPQCSANRKPGNRRDPCLSVTIDSDGGAVWNCHNCQWADNVPGQRRERYDPPKREYKRPVEVKEKPRPDKMLEWFAKRKISPATVEHFGVYRTERYVGEKMEPCIAFPYRHNDELLNVKYRTADKRFIQEGGAERSLYNIDAVAGIWDSDDCHHTVIFVEGEMDVLALYEAGISYAVSLPDGAPKEATYREDDARFTALGHAEWLSDAEKIIIAVDNDGPGNALALELAHRFGKDRCWKVEWPNLNDCPCKDANEALIEHGAEVVRECIEGATPYPIDGLYSAGEYRMELLEIYRGNIQRPVSTGFSKLDEIYQVMPGAFNVVTGIPNHGKSNFVDQLAMNLAEKHGWKFAVFSPEHSSAMHLRRLTEKRARKPFDVGLMTKMTEADLHSAVDFIQDHFMFIESKDAVPDIEWLLSKARAACVRHGVRGVVFDPYNEISAVRSAGKREDEHIRDLISHCKRFCQSHNIAMWMVAHPAKMRRGDDGKYPMPSLYDISGASHWYNMVDAGIVVHRDFNAGTTKFSTAKIREQGVYGNLGDVDFRFNTSKRVYEEIETDAPSGGNNYQD
jgi:twinkle protein